jgi:hypothetical protein
MIRKQVGSAVSTPAAQPRWCPLATITQVRRPPPSNRPTEELLRRHVIEPPQVDSTAFRQGWQVRSRLDTLLRDGLISPAEYGAAESWQRDFHAAAERSTNLVASLEMRPDGSCGRREPSERQLRAVRHQRETAAALGAARVRILDWC